MHDLGGTGTATLSRPAGRPDSRNRPELSQVVIADDSPLMHLAVRSMLTGAPGLALAAAASTVVAAEQLIQRVRPDLLICDTTIGADSGIALCRWTRQASPVTAVVMLTSRDEPLLVQSALTAGASGYLLKDSSADALLAAVCQVAAGGTVLDEQLGRQRHRGEQPDCVAELGLSRREREVLDELRLGLDNKAIALRLCISEDTVKSHVKAIFRKLGARDRAHAVALALGSAPPAAIADAVTAARPGTARRGSAMPQPRLAIR
jgi:DNA-binding NarL/FixJ family response regulator